MSNRNPVKQFLLSIFFLAFNVQSQNVLIFDNWSYVVDDKYKKIHTLNIHNIEFGYVCNNGCTFYITPSPVCIEDLITTGWLIQTNGVSTKIDTMCVVNNNANVLVINPNQHILPILKSNTEVHFLINFDVKTNSLMTFSLNGFNSSLKKLTY